MPVGDTLVWVHPSYCTVARILFGTKFCTGIIGVLDLVKKSRNFSEKKMDSPILYFHSSEKEEIKMETF